VYSSKEEAAARCTIIRKTAERSAATAFIAQPPNTGGGTNRKSLEIGVEFYLPHTVRRNHFVVLNEAHIPALL
jgi:hypothetical protein